MSLSSISRQLWLLLIAISVIVTIFITQNPSFFTSLSHCITNKDKNEGYLKTTGPDTIILLWFPPFGKRSLSFTCDALYNIQGCQITMDRNLYSKANGVMFHHRDMQKNLSGMPNMPRPAHQKWIWWNHESPSHSLKIAALNNLFNLTANYRRDADIFMPYGKLLQVDNQGEDFEIPKKDKLVCWIVSNWRNRYRRYSVYNELKQHIQIDMYGRHVGKRVSSAGRLSWLPTVHSG
ncbi:alpha-(1,3)-fucosyltransferase 9-like [Denticeps clupeoides]|uniref:alpha-(1,3)-fucosyltransferase 9-like n=1 Tax=Denticeps clupeoides TaxID=299321 RepID=UPI0010A4FF6B|nr:alpha-(1,3)-fucosyltransferase 9-like [Denticeps clupeoides]